MHFYESPHWPTERWECDPRSPTPNSSHTLDIYIFCMYIDKIPVCTMDSMVFHKPIEVHEVERSSRVLL
jgi:hypothetical protein